MKCKGTFRHREEENEREFSSNPLLISRVYFLNLILGISQPRVRREKKKKL
jgi:hypothetical protein